MNRDIVNIKGTKQGLVICLSATHEFDELKKTLKTKIESSRGFFRGAKFTFHLDHDSLPAERTKELEEICCEHGLVPDTEIKWPSANKTPFPSGRPIKVPESEREKAMSANVRPLMREASPSLPSAGVAEADKRPCLLVNRSLRSGQKVNFNGNVVVLGDVNPGSEITANGDIVVLGSLRGVVHAGADGSQESTIMAYRLNPVQLRIGPAISRPPENNPVSPFPEIARLQNGQMYIEPYMTHGLKR
ncbi:MAG: septum site-determining protein MinC [Firmicutes bacterium HGW-Firmicutes-14]|nr:MAG: septum site-determining protein MinC [Firmicutes bacterium HGW-Firmicutes-14]